jgi:hypothetical protein
VDASGADVYPGFIDAATTIGLDEPGPRGFDDSGEMLELSPQLRTRVAYHAESDAIPVARVNGVTTVAVVPAGGVFGGEVPVMNLAGWTWEEATLRANAGIQFTFPAVGATGGRGGFGGGRRGQPPPDRAYDDLRRERDRRLDEIVRLFEQAGRPTGSSRPSCPWSNANCRFSPPPIANTTSATPSRSPIAQASISSSSAGARPCSCRRC